jgi:hypothetical protein
MTPYALYGAKFIVKARKAQFPAEYFNILMNNIFSRTTDFMQVFDKKTHPHSDANSNDDTADSD